MRKRYTAEDKARLIAEVQSGESVAAVAKRLGVTASTAYLWIKAAPTATAAAPMFAQVVRASELRRSAMTIEVGGVTIRVEPGFDAGLLGAVVAALSSKT
jgi:transposase-like protein